MRNEGVTILQIVITIIIMVFILGVTVLYGQNAAREANFAATYNEIREIESVFKEMYLLNHIKVNTDSVTFYSELDAPKVNNSDYTEQLGPSPSGNFYYLDFTSSRKLQNVLGLEKVKNDYLFDLVNLNIYLVDGVSIPKVTTNPDGTENIEEVIEYDSDKIVKYYTDTFVK